MRVQSIIQSVGIMPFVSKNSLASILLHGCLKLINTLKVVNLSNLERIPHDVWEKKQCLGCGNVFSDSRLSMSGLRQQEVNLVPTHKTQPGPVPTLGWVGTLGLGAFYWGYILLATQFSAPCSGRSTAWAVSSSGHSVCVHTGRLRSTQWAKSGKGRERKGKTPKCLEKQLHMHVFFSW